MSSRGFFCTGVHFPPSLFCSEVNGTWLPVGSSPTTITVLIVWFDCLMACMVTFINNNESLPVINEYSREKKGLITSNAFSRKAGEVTKVPTFASLNYTSPPAPISRHTKPPHLTTYLILTGVYILSIQYLISQFPWGRVRVDRSDYCPSSKGPVKCHGIFGTVGQH